VQPLGHRLALVVDRLVETQLVDDPAALLVGARQTDHLGGPTQPGDLPDGRAGRPGRPRDHNRVAFGHRADVEQAKVRRHAVDAEEVEGQGRLDARRDHLQAGLASPRNGEVLPSEHPKDEIAHGMVRGVGGDHLPDARAPDDLADANGG
jgi:hypothetical protein